MKQIIHEKEWELIGDYILRQNLGNGSFGTVYLGQHLLTGCPVAIKIIEKKKIKDNNDLILIKREIHILKIVKHSSIAQLYEILETQNRIYLVMEYAEKGDLFSYIQKNDLLEEKQAIKYFKQILNVVIYLKKLKIAHRDLKPENILIDQFDSIKIIDFGLSNIYEKNKYMETFCGSPCYVAPEMIIRKKYKAEDIDSWSLGVILYLMLTQNLPFHNNTNSLNELYDQILNTRVQYQSHLSLEAVDFFKKIFLIDSNQRMTIEQMCNHALIQKYNLQVVDNSYIVIEQMPVIDQQIYEQTLKMFKNEISILNVMLDYNIYNRYTSTYYLLLKLKYLSQQVSPYDINSQYYRSSQVESTQQADNDSNKNQESEEIAKMFLNQYKINTQEATQILSKSKEKLIGLNKFQKKNHIKKSTKQKKSGNKQVKNTLSQN